MFYLYVIQRFVIFPVRPSLFVLAALLCLSVTPLAQTPSPQQIFERELNVVGESVEVIIRNSRGRVTVTATDENRKSISIRSTSTNPAATKGDVRAEASGSSATIEVSQPLEDNGARNMNERDRIDLTIQVPQRARLKITTVAGAIDATGNFREVEASSDTGTIRADVPIESLNYTFLWTASRPRYYSEIELAKVKEQRGGTFEIGGRLGDRKADEAKRVRLQLTTARGVILFGVDPNAVPVDLRERALTEAARVIIRSGNEDLIEAIRKIAPRYVGDYAETLPFNRTGAPKLITSRGGEDSNGNSSGEQAQSVSPRAVRLNASVTDRQGRAIAGLTAKDFVVVENGEEVPVTNVEGTNAPFNLVLLLDVSGSVEERLDFIRKSALNFVRTVGQQDRIAVVTFRDDVQIISDFTTDRALLAQRINNIDAGGATILYDAIVYTLVETLRPLRNERTAVVVFSDGDDNRSFLPFPAVIEAARESGAQIYPLYVPSGLIPASSAPAASTTLDPTRTRFLTLTTRADEEGRRFAGETGGVYYPVARIEDLQRAYNDIIAQLRTAYTITYQSKRAAGGRAAPARVRVRREGLTVRTSPAISVASMSRP
ncbi:MAG: VWA domain-containing protein [Pyrinomonadaceae bacterium]|nr:VWA domain-containing protein [Pyrinomonadaceae bacterium]